VGLSGDTTMMNIRTVSLRATALSALLLSSSYAFAQQSPVSNTLRVRDARRDQGRDADICDRHKEAGRHV
jgi:hypothetical protein